MYQTIMCPRQINVLIRTDASFQIGTGHVMRCLTLADQLLSKGCNVEFICRPLPGNLCSYIENKGFKVHRLSVPSATDYRTVLRHGHWLGVHWKTDAHETIQVLDDFKNRGYEIDWLIVDHYALDRNWESCLQTYVKKIMVIDDLADRFHQCDILLDQNFFGDHCNRYKQLVPRDCKTLLGPKYALLRSDFVKFRKRIVIRNRVRRVLVFLGGSDPSNETVKALNSIKLLNRPDLIYHIVVGSSNPQKDVIQEMCESLPNVYYHCQISNMAELMSNADLAIGACGVATWERCCLGLPSLVITVANNQEAIANYVAQAGAIIHLGVASEVTVDRIVQSMNRIIDDSEALSKMSVAGMKLVDGLGTKRVVTEVLKRLQD